MKLILVNYLHRYTITLDPETSEDYLLLKSLPSGATKYPIVIEEKPGYLTINIELLKDKLQ